MEDLIIRDLWIVLLQYLSPLDRYTIISTYLPSLGNLLLIPETSYRVASPSKAFIFRCNVLFPAPARTVRSSEIFPRMRFALSYLDSVSFTDNLEAVYLPPNIIIFQKIDRTWAISSEGSIILSSKFSGLDQPSNPVELISGLNPEESRSIYDQLTNLGCIWTFSYSN